MKAKATVQGKTEKPEASPLLNLSAPRIIRLTIGKQPIDFTFGRLTDKNWRTFFEGIVSRVEIEKGERTRIETEDAALAQLVGEAVIDITINGEKKGMLIAPPRFLIAAGVGLRMAFATADEADLLSELTEIKLNAAWTLDHDKGTMTMYTGLVHRFREPSIEQLRRYKMGVSRVKVSGDAQKGVTIYPSRLAVALSLYDELIAEVEGYADGNVDLAGIGPCPKEIAAAMDGFHKAIAVRELFERSEEQVWIGKPDAQPTEAADEDGE